MNFDFLDFYLDFYIRNMDKFRSMNNFEWDVNLSELTYREKEILENLPKPDKECKCEFSMPNMTPVAFKCERPAKTMFKMFRRPIYLCYLHALDFTLYYDNYYAGNEYVEFLCFDCHTKAKKGK